MADKKPTRKEQREAAEKEALRQRLYDMLAGAVDGYLMQDDGEDDVLISPSASLEQISDWMRCAKQYLRFVIDKDRWPGEVREFELRSRAFDFGNLRFFETLTSTVDHLYDYGFRA